MANTIYIIKAHKVTGEIVKVDVATTKVPVIDGRITDAVFAKVKESTEKNTEYNVIGLEGNPAAVAHKGGLTVKQAWGKIYSDERSITQIAIDSGR